MAEGLGSLNPMDIYENITTTVGEYTLASTTIAVAPRQSHGNPIHVNVINVTFYAIIFVLAVVGNSLVVVTLLQNKRMRSVTNVFLLSLSVSDLLFVCVCLPFTLVGNIIHHFIFGPVMCRLIVYFQSVSVAVSVWTMVAIALERYHAICNPLASRAWQTKSRAYKIIAIIWSAAFIVTLPDLIFTELIAYDAVSMKVKCRPNMQMPFQAIYPCMLFAIFMVIPLICLFFAYGLIVFELWRGIMSEKRATAKEKEENGTPMKDLKNATSSRAGPDSNANDPFLRKDGKAIYRPPPAKAATRSMGHVRSTSSNNAKKRVVRMLIVLVLLFFALWSPSWVINIWFVLKPEGIYRLLSPRPVLMQSIRLMSYFSACVNPIVYCFMNRSFRNGFLEAFTCCAKRYRPFTEDIKPRHGATTHATRVHHRPDSTTNYTNVSSGEDD